MSQSQSYYTQEQMKRIREIAMQYSVNIVFKPSGKK